MQNVTVEDNKPYRVTLWLLLLFISVVTALSVDYFPENLPIENLLMLMIFAILVLFGWHYGL
jgi:hypothetical protein